MAKLLLMDVYLANHPTHENIQYIGKIQFGVCVDNGISSMTAYQYPSDNYNFFTSAVDDGLFFGGDIVAINSKSDTIDKIKLYCPLTKLVTFSTDQDFGGLEFKFVAPDGKFAVKRLRTSYGVTGLPLYNSDGSALGTSIPLSCDNFNAAQSSVGANWLVVSDFTDPNGNFSTDQDLYGVLIQDNYYWSKQKLSLAGEYKQIAIDFLNSLEKYTPPSEDPYDGAGDSGVGDFPQGNFNYTNNDIGDADSFRLPIVSAVDTGFVTLYNPTVAELKQLSNYLWSNNFDLNTFKKIFNDPMDLFIGLSIVPVQVPDGPSKEVGIGLIPTGVYMTTAASQWVKVDCGTCDVPNFSGGYLDYSPYTKVEIYLPYIGFRTLNADELSGKQLHCTYFVDILSGSCTCWLDVLNPLDESFPVDNEWLTTYVFMGECATSIPLASGDWTNLINGIIGVAASVGTGFATGGAGGAIAGGVSAASSVAVNDSKINVERSGAITSAGGLLAPQQPYLIISTPRIHKPADTPYYTGYPAYFTASLGNMTGYTEVAEIRLSNLSATVEEKSEIEMLLKGGVIL